MADLLQRFAAFVQLYKTTEGVPKAAGYTLCFGKPLLLVILMGLTPAVPKEQALLTRLMPGQEGLNSSAVML